MIGQPGRANPKLVIVEGIMGSGKTTTVLRATERLRALGIAAIGITEGTNPHPIRYDWDYPWSEVRARDLASAQLAKWRSYAESARAGQRISLVDGQLFHGNLTALFLLEADLNLITMYCRELVAALAPLSPQLIYFRQDNVDAAIRTVSAQRGETWVAYQTSWKLSSPYAVRRGLTGLDGLIALYRAYRVLTDQLFEDIEVPKLRIENSLQEWLKYEAMIDQVVLRSGSLQGPAGDPGSMHLGN